jgi:hypothetical protein
MVRDVLASLALFGGSRCLWINSRTFLLMLLILRLMSGTIQQYFFNEDIAHMISSSAWYRPYPNLLQLYFHKMAQKDALLQQSLEQFFSDPLHAVHLKNTLDPSRERHISLRLIDWICTTYSKKHRLLFARPNGSIVDIHSSYKSHLRSFGKNRFDIFRRGKKITIPVDGGTIETTLAQLNFIRWLINHDVLTYLEENKAIPGRAGIASAGGRVHDGPTNDVVPRIVDGIADGTCHSVPFARSAGGGRNRHAQ